MSSYTSTSLGDFDDLDEHLCHSTIKNY